MRVRVGARVRVRVRTRVRVRVRVIEGKRNYIQDIQATAVATVARSRSTLKG